VSIAKETTALPPVWHDGTCSNGRLSGEIRVELETLTPMLVGWERGQADDAERDWPVPASLPEVGNLPGKKSVLCPLRAPWGKQPVIIPGDSLKGLMRHELGALLGSPMERVAERSYSYRPNALFPNRPNPKLIARIARVPRDGVVMKPLGDKHQVRVPSKLEILSPNLRYDRRREASNGFYRFDDGSNGGLYRGGQGAGAKLNSKRNLHRRLHAFPGDATETAMVSEAVQDGYIATIKHLTDIEHGHFSERHPDVPNTVKGVDARDRILKAAMDEVFQPGDLIWVEWDSENQRIVSLGWHYYYRWTYADSIRLIRGKFERHGLFPLPAERECDIDGAPVGLSPVRRLLGYTGDNDGSNQIGEKDFSQLLGRVSVNAGVEVVGDNETDSQRFLGPTFLKELGMPRPSAVEHYLKQPHFPRQRPSDEASLATYGDAAGYDAPGELAGRKFYLDRKDSYAGTPWEDSSQANRDNDRSTLAIGASKANRKFRFTVRFHDLDASELAAIVVAFCPNQTASVLGGTHSDGYCSKLGYARPLGWGSVRMETKAILLLQDASGMPELKNEPDVVGWVKKNYKATSMQDEWLAIHRRNHPTAKDYPRLRDRDGNENIYTFHTALRADHCRNRRYRRSGP